MANFLPQQNYVAYCIPAMPRHTANAMPMAMTMSMAMAAPLPLAYGLRTT